MDEFLRQLAAHIRSNRLLPRKARIVVAVSGGLDSVALLHALSELSDDFAWTLEVAHFNHHLRGRQSGTDQRLVERHARRLILPLSVGHWKTSEREAAIRVNGIEKAAREARRVFLGTIARKTRAQHIALAHHADDQAELFFIRLLRGASSRGLSGMQPRSRHGAPLNAWVVRPFLHLRRSQLEEWVAKRRLRHRHDASNDDSRHLRNRVRHELLPAVARTLGGDPVPPVLRAMRTLADESAWLRDHASQLLETATTSAFDELHPAVQRQLLALQLERAGRPFDSDALERLRAAADQTLHLPGGTLVSRDTTGRLHIHANRPATAGDESLALELAGGRKAEFASLEFQWSFRRSTGHARFTTGRELFDADRVGNHVMLRHWRPGDRFQPIGMPRPVKLQDLFTNARVPRDLRDRLVIAETGDDGIFWVERLRMGERFKLTAATRRVLVWRWSSGSPIPRHANENPPLQP